jgi:hypothetical protein
LPGNSRSAAGRKPDSVISGLVSFGGIGGIEAPVHGAALANERLYPAPATALPFPTIPWHPIPIPTTFRPLMGSL